MAETQGIAVSGTGEAKGVPDIATVQIGIETTATTVAEARAKGAEAATKLIASVKANGVEEKDIKTVAVSLQPQYEYAPNVPAKLIGYQATNSVVVTVRKLETAGKIIDDGAQAAGDAARVQGIQFGFANPEALLEEARGKAMANARARAESYAKAAGVKVGDVEYISEYQQPAVPMPRAPATGAAASLFASPETPIQAGESAASVTISVRFAIAR